MNTNKNFIAHVRATDQTTQTVAKHLSEVADIAKDLARKLNVPEAGELIGLLHDFGKYSQNFQDYLKSGTGLLDPDLDDAYVDAKAQKGKIDHSTVRAPNGCGRSFIDMVSAVGYAGKYWHCALLPITVV